MQFVPCDYLSDDEFKEKYTIFEHSDMKLGGTLIQERCKKAVENFKDLTAYVTISFTNAEQKRVFCELAEIAEDEAFISGEKVLEMIN